MRRSRWLQAAVAMAAAAGCGDGPDRPVIALGTIEPALQIETVEPHVDATLVLEVAPTGNAARYRVREQLVGFDLPNDAVGMTRAVSGRIVFDEQGTIDRAASAIVVDVTGLESDQSRRDNYVRSRTLRTAEHPTVTLRPTGLVGLPVPMPTAGTHTFTLTGDLTVLDATRPTTWQVTAQFGADGVTGTATTRFAFDDFGLTKPRVSVVLSVADSIGLEYDFDLRRATHTH